MVLRSQQAAQSGAAAARGARRRLWSSRGIKRLQRALSRARREARLVLLTRERRDDARAGWSLAGSWGRRHQEDVGGKAGGIKRACVWVTKAGIDLWRSRDEG